MARYIPTTFQHATTSEDTLLQSEGRYLLEFHIGVRESEKKSTLILIVGTVRKFKRYFITAQPDEPLKQRALSYI
jgi:hypothetical protein